MDHVAKDIEAGTRLSRFAKILPHRVLPDYDKSLYIDANLEIRGTLGPLFDQLENAPAVFYEHPEDRYDVYAEAEACIAHKKDDAELLQQHVQRYRDLGFPGRSKTEARSIPAGMLILRRHDQRDVQEAMEVWWEEYVSGARRDQLSLAYALWQAGLSHTLLKGNVRSNEFVQWHRHSAQTASRDLAKEYTAASAIILHLPGSGEHWVKQLFNGSNATTDSEKSKRKLVGKTALNRVIFDDNILGVAPHGAPKLQLLHKDLLLSKPVALLIGDPRWEQVRSHKVAISRGAQLSDEVNTAQTDVYGKSRREAYLAMLRDFVAEHPGSTAVIEERSLLQFRFKELTSWTSEVGLHLKRTSLVYKTLFARINPGG